MSASPAPAVPAFVVSSGRCGSTLLGRMLGLHPDVLSVSEAFAALQPTAFPDGQLSGAAFADLLRRPRGSWSCLLRHGIEPAEVRYDFEAAGAAHTRTSGVPPLALMTLPSLTADADALNERVLTRAAGHERGDAASHYARLFSWLATEFERTRWLERSGASLAWVADLVSTFPTARFVHLHRDGAATGRSMRDHAAFRMLVARARLASWLGVDPFESEDRARLARVPVAWRALLPESFDAEAFASIDIPLTTFVGLWATMETRGLEVLDGLGDGRLVHVRYEDLLDDPVRELRRIAEVVELDGDSWIDAAARLVRRPSPSPHGDGDGGRLVALACRITEERLARSTGERGRQHGKGYRRPRVVAQRQ